jgi:glycerate 2-kinase
MPSPSVLACPASLKGVLSAREAASALADGLRTWARVDELPVADGGEGTLDVLHAALGGEWRETEVHDAFGRKRTARWLWRDGDAFIEAAQAIPLDPERLDPLEASSQGLGELVEAVGNPAILFVALGGTATVDGGWGMRSVVRRLPAPTVVLCDVDVPLIDAARVFAPQKGASTDHVRLLEQRLLALDDLRPFADVPGAGAAGGLGAAFASLGARLEPGAAVVLALIRFNPLHYHLVVTGEGTVDATTFRGKAPGEVVRVCQAERKRCVLFGGRVTEVPPEVEVVELSGDPAKAREDLVALGQELGSR